MYLDFEITFSIALHHHFEGGFFFPACPLFQATLSNVTKDRKGEKNIRTLTIPGMLNEVEISIG
jgi:hypothetical protein